MSRRGWMLAAVAVIGSVWVAGCGGGGGDATGTTVASAIVPDVTGLTAIQAVKKLRASGLTTIVRFRYATTPDGTVINQLPPPGTTAQGGNASITVSKGGKPAPKPKPTKPKPQPKPPPKPEPVNTENQACSGYSGVDGNACHDSYEYACVDGQVQQNVRDYYEGNAPDLATQAQRWALSYYTRGGSWMAGMAGCLAALMDEYNRQYGA